MTFYVGIFNFYKIIATYLLYANGMTYKSITFVLKKKLVTKTSPNEHLPLYSVMLIGKCSFSFYL